MSNHRRLAFALSVALAFAAGALLRTTPEAGARDEADVPATARVYFSPNGGIEPALLDVLKEAKREVLLAMFHLSSRPLVDALVAARRRGVDVRVVLDANKAAGKGRLDDLRRAKVPTRLMRLGKTGDDLEIHFHHKFLVVDRALVATGSFNWTAQADGSNYENEVILRSPKLADEYRGEFERIWTQAEEDGGRK
jgi:phosphatidylserine/phosphatidylglycerophosphate/cardiolipin synthase-like enzyme